MKAQLPETALQLGTARSVMRELFEYGKQRAAVVGADNVFDFSLGNPSVPPPACVNDCIRSLLDGPQADSIHTYTSAQGDAGCRAALAQKLNQRFGADADAGDLYLTVGAAASLTVTLHATCCPGDEIVLLAPYFAEYKVFARGAGASVVVVPANESIGFQPDIGAIARALTPATKAVIINTPNNPTGAVYTGQSLAALANLLKERSTEYGHPIYLISDEPYRELVFDGVQTAWPAQYYQNTVVCYSYSKSLSLPGERIGYIYLPKALCDHDRLYAAVCGAGRLLGFVNAPALFQHVAAACDGQTADITIYQHNAELIYTRLTQLGFTCLKPQGTFYLFLKAPIADAAAFCEKAREFDLLLVPADSFACPGWVRIAFCVPTEKLERSFEAFHRLADAYAL